MAEAERIAPIHIAAGHHSAGRYAEAEAGYRAILARSSNHFDALHLLGTLCAQTGRRPDGIDLMMRACAINPNVAVVHNNLGMALRASGQTGRAIASFRRAVELDPKMASALSNMGHAFYLQDEPDAAIAACLRALEIRPDLADAWTNLGMARAARGGHSRALADSKRAVELDPSHARAQLNLAILQLQTGDYEQGWGGYEWRWRCADLETPRAFTQPAWDGGDLAGKTLLLYAEQGFGDTIQFVRFVALTAERGGRILLEAQRSLTPVLRDLPGVHQCIAAGSPLPSFDVRCSLLSLPGRLGSTLKTIPARVPYLKPDPRLVERWKQRVVEAAGDTLRVGLAWAGQPKHPNDRNRSMRLDQFAPLAADGMTFFSLLRGPAAAGAANPPPGIRLIDFSAEWADFSDTAALVANLDLIISVDTSAAHLAGALGRPVWTLLPFNPDWRWLLEREDSPWYPTMRLFRQRRAGDWQDVIERVRTALAGYT